MVEKAKQIITPQNLLIGLNIWGILAIVYFGMQLWAWKTKMEYMQDKVSKTESSVTIIKKSIEDINIRLAVLNAQLKKNEN